MKRNQVCCRNCALFDIEHVKSKTGRIMNSKAAKCAWVSVELYPASLRYGNNRPAAGYVTPDSGKNCPCFKQRTPDQSGGD